MPPHERHQPGDDLPPAPQENQSGAEEGERTLNAAAFKRFVVVLLVAIVLIGGSVGTIVVTIAYRRIGVLEQDLRERRAVRDEQAQQTKDDVCLLLNHMVNPTSPELQDLRQRYGCPPLSASDVPSAPTPNG